MKDRTPNIHAKKWSRREFIATGAAAGTGLLAGCASSKASRRAKILTKPNFLLIITDQQALRTLSAFGSTHAKTPNMDYLAANGVSFMQSHCTFPQCSPSRSSLFTGRMPSEAGVFHNGMPIREDIPNLGQWLAREGYENAYIGKWHLPHSFSAAIPGFDAYPGGLHGKGTMGDRVVSRSCEAWLSNRSKSEQPFFLVASLLQPHDICQWVAMHRDTPDGLPYPWLSKELPPLPDNFNFDPLEPARMEEHRQKGWTEMQWRYYLWSYARMIEEADAEIGRILDALIGTGNRDNTVVVFVSDHGEGQAHHQMVLKNYLYDEAVKVPLVFSCPARIESGLVDTSHLVSGLDLTPTLCSFAGCPAPPGNLGINLQPLLRGGQAGGHEFVVAEASDCTGRMLRTARYKYITYEDDPVEQLFDMTEDPGETVNLARSAAGSQILTEHRSLLEQWEDHLDKAPKSKSKKPGP